MSTDNTGFDLNKAIDDTQSVSFNYTSLGLTNIFHNEDQQFISAAIESSSSSNFTHTKNNKAYEYKATNLYIVGVSNNTKINQIRGINSLGQLIIKNERISGENSVIYMCFPLIITNDKTASDYSDKQTDIDSVMQLSMNGSATQLQANFQKTFEDHISGGKFVIYTSSNNNSTVVTFGGIFKVKSIVLMQLQNNLTLFDLQPAEYSIVKSPTPGEWMECDYVDIDSDEVVSYNLPVGSGLVQDNAAYSSLRTMMMYIMFIICTGLSYILIPHVYIYMLKFLFNLLDVKNPSGQSKQMTNFDAGMLGFMCFIAFILIFVGVVSNQSVAPLLLLYGVLLGIGILLGHIIISSKKSQDEGWPINEIQKSYVK